MVLWLPDPPSPLGDRLLLVRWGTRVLRGQRQRKGWRGNLQKRRRAQANLLAHPSPCARPCLKASDKCLPAE